MSQNPENTDHLKCPFRATLITRSFACEHASEVTRRDGPDIGCSSESINKHCWDYFNALKKHALPELGFADDLTSMPASALQKIQFGGLLALQAINSDGCQEDSIDNISALIQSVFDKYQAFDNLPYDQCLQSIKNYKIKRRRGK
jgi:hypothetical protein